MDLFTRLAGRRGRWCVSRQSRVRIRSFSEKLSGYRAVELIVMSIFKRRLVGANCNNNNNAR